MPLETPSLEVISVHEGRPSWTRIPVPDDQPVAGLEAGADDSVFTAVIGPFDTPGALTWRVEAVTEADEVLRTPWRSIGVREC